MGASSNSSAAVKQFVKIAGLLFLFSAAMGYLEGAVVVYLRELYYPEGFQFPLRAIDEKILLVEIGREASTMGLLSGFAALAGRSFYQRLGFFLAAFGAWDIFYYVTLKFILDWPASFFTWDLLFLIPLPWVGPVIAPLLIAIFMVLCGLLILWRYCRGGSYWAGLHAWLVALLGCAVMILAFLADFAAPFAEQLPGPFPYWLWGVGLFFTVTAFVQSYWQSGQECMLAGAL